MAGMREEKMRPKLGFPFSSPFSVIFGNSWDIAAAAAAGILPKCTGEENAKSHPLSITLPYMAKKSPPPPIYAFFIFA